jgi:hypothetical protein
VADAAIRKNVGHEARPSPVAVRERVYGNEAVVELHRDRVRRKRLVIDPELRLLECLMQARLNQRPFDTELLVGLAIGSGPPPDIVEHAAMKIAPEGLAHGVPAAHERPGVRPEDVLRLQFIELAAQRYMGGEEAFALFGRE